MGNTQAEKNLKPATLHFHLNYAIAQLQLELPYSLQASYLHFTTSNETLTQL